MPTVVVAQVIERPIADVWEELRHIDRHVDWMLDAEEIRFLTEHRQGELVRFECDTRIGPLKVTDVMEITKWEEPHAMRVRHVGLVTGEGEIGLRSVGPSSTKVTWTETLSFPIRLGGKIGAFIAYPVFKWIWSGNLRRLAAQPSLHVT